MSPSFGSSNGGAQHESGFADLPRSRDSSFFFFFGRRFWQPRIVAAGHARRSSHTCATVPRASAIDKLDVGRGSPSANRMRRTTAAFERRPRPSAIVRPLRLRLLVGMQSRTGAAVCSLVQRWQCADRIGGDVIRESPACRPHSSGPRDLRQPVYRSWWEHATAFRRRERAFRVLRSNQSSRASVRHDASGADTGRRCAPHPRGTAKCALPRRANRKLQGLANKAERVGDAAIRGLSRTEIDPRSHGLGRHRPHRWCPSARK